jgi:hypothetical protein
MLTSFIYHFKLWLLFYATVTFTFFLLLYLCDNYVFKMFEGRTKRRSKIICKFSHPDQNREKFIVI